MMKKEIAIAVIGLAALAGALLSLYGCAREQSGEKPGTADGPVTGVRFVYDMYSGDQFYLNAYAENISESGASVTIEKRVGPSNSFGHRKEGTLTLDGGQAEALLEILSRYDLAAWSALPLAGSGSAPSRSLIVFSGKNKMYDIRWNAKFPKTLPPEEDIMYFELYRFFNALVAAEPGWEEVRSADLPDPRDNPAYSERTVTWFGRTVRLVPGTGTYHEDGRYAEIDYEGRDWWTEEGFVGRWVLDEGDPDNGPEAPGSAVLEVRGDGSVLLTLDGVEWSGTVSGVRRYRDDVRIEVGRGYETRPCAVELKEEESYEHIRVTCYPGPVPEPQFDPIDVSLAKSGD